MTLKLGIATGPPVRKNLPATQRGRHAPNLSVRWSSSREQFGSSVAALLHGPVAPRHFPGVAFFRDCCIETRLPKKAFVAAVAIEALLIVFPPPIWNVAPVRSAAHEAQQQITWYRPAPDLPELSPAAPVRKAAPKVRSSIASEPPATEAFHPRQTVITAPRRPTHPRQTLIEPSAPALPPRILPPLPNIVQIATPVLARPKPQLNAALFAALRPRQPATPRVSSADASRVDIVERQIGPIDIAPGEGAAVPPVVPVTPMSAPLRTQQKQVQNAAAPDVKIAASAVTDTMIALSATPAPVEPPIEPPRGNLSSRIAVSPEGTGDSAGVKNGLASSGIAASGSSSDLHGPQDIFITGGNSANRSSSAQLSAPPQGPGAVTSSKPESRANIGSSEGKSVSSVADLAPGAAPESLLGSKRVYTLHVNMPNITSVSGSWVLNFAEMDDPLSPAPRDFAREGQVAAPVPLRKVDPRYPPELRVERVEGDVVLYAIIRKDGSVDSIQLVRGVDQRLDANAMAALAQWKFQPGEKQGAPIDLEAVVHISFRSRETQY